jgi:hypothetical protein
MFLVAEIVPSPRRQSYFTDAFKEERMIFSGVDFAVPRGVKKYSGVWIQSSSSLHAPSGDGIQYLQAGIEARSCFLAQVFVVSPSRNIGCKARRLFFDDLQRATIVDLLSTMRDTLSTIVNDARHTVDDFLDNRILCGRGVGIPRGVGSGINPSPTLPPLPPPILGLYLAVVYHRCRMLYFWAILYNCFQMFKNVGV